MDFYYFYLYKLMRRNFFLPSAGEGSVLYNLLSNLHRWNMLDQLLIVNLHKFLTLFSTLELHIKRNKAP